MKEQIKDIFEESIKTKKKVLEKSIENIEKGAIIIIKALKKGNKILVCGNGGSAADAQHLVAELVIRFEKDRKGLPAIALTTNTSNLTAGGNDLGFDSIFAKQVEALGKEGDIIIGITTSGNSKNIIKAFEVAEKKRMIIICLNGKDGGIISKMKTECNIIIPSQKTARIQENHITIIHAWCKLIEDELFKE